MQNTTLEATCHYFYSLFLFKGKKKTHFILFPGSGDVHEELWEAISQWSGKVSLSQWAHQSGFTQGNPCFFNAAIPVRLQLYIHENSFGKGFVSQWKLLLSAYRKPYGNGWRINPRTVGQYIHLLFSAVFGCPGSGASEEEGVRSNVQLDGEDAWWDQDSGRLSDAEKTGWALQKRTRMWQTITIKYLYLFIYLTINNISENMPELARRLIFICSPHI